MRKLTPILFVETVEPSVRFWVDRLAFKTENEVIDDGRLAFVSVARGNVEIMYQARASLMKDAPELARELGPPTCLYIEVDDIDALIEKLDGVEVVMPKREMFYGMEEFGVREPGGHLVTFAARVARS